MRISSDFEYQNDLAFVRLMRLAGSPVEMQNRASNMLQDVKT